MDNVCVLVGQLNVGVFYKIKKRPQLDAAFLILIRSEMLKQVRQQFIQR
jgi:hypothetical protein